MKYVIPHYGSEVLLRQTIKSVRRTDPQATIYVGDDSHQLNTKDFLNCKIILGSQQGFAANVNNVMRKIKKGFVVILNNDMQLAEDWHKNIRFFIERNKNREIIIASKIVNSNGLIDSAGDCFSWFGQGYNRLHLKPSHFKVNPDERIIGATGGLMVVRAETFHKLNGFDELFESYVEDTDFNIRAVKNGIDPLYCSDAKATHLGTATFKEEKKFYLSARNTTLNIRKNFTSELQKKLLFRNNLYWLIKSIVQLEYISVIRRGLSDGKSIPTKKINFGAKINSLSEISNDTFWRSLWRLINL